MQVKCHVCGKPLELPDIPDTVAEPFRSALVNIAMMAVHGDDTDAGSCAYALWKRQYDKSQSERLMERAATIDSVVPAEFQETKLDHPQMQRPIAVLALSWVFGPRGLLLAGPTGQCKSRCAYEILRREHLAGRRCLQYSAGEWSMACKSMNSNREVAGRWIHAVRECDILLIDDLGKARLAYHDREATQATELLFDVCDSRFKNHKPVFVTTNLRADDFPRLWGEHGASFMRRLVTFCEVLKFES